MFSEKKFWATSALPLWFTNNLIRHSSYMLHLILSKRLIGNLVRDLDKATRVFSFFSSSLLYQLAVIYVYAGALIFVLSLSQGYSQVLMIPWGHDSTLVNGSNLLVTLNDALTHSSILAQGYGWRGEGEVVHVTFPFERENVSESEKI